MSNDLENALGELSEGLATVDCVGAIGLSGNNRALPEPGEGDINMQPGRGKLFFIGYDSNHRRVLAPCPNATLGVQVGNSPFASTQMGREGSSGEAPITQPLQTVLDTQHALEA